MGYPVFTIRRQEPCAAGTPIRLAAIRALVVLDQVAAGFRYDLGVTSSRPSSMRWTCW